jgi:hypothetical protein
MSDRCSALGVADAQVAAARDDAAARLALMARVFRGPAWPYEERRVWRSRKMPFAGRVLGRVT